MQPHTGQPQVPQLSTGSPEALPPSRPARTWAARTVALLGLLAVLVTVVSWRRSVREQDRRVRAEAADGVAQIEGWLADRHPR